MASYAFTDAYLFMDSGAADDGPGQEVGQYGRSLSLDMAAEVLDTTTFQSTARTRVGGLTDVALTGELLFDGAVAVPDTTTGQAYGTVGAVSLLPDGNAAGDTAYGFQRLATNYSHGGTVGDLFTVNFDAQGRTRAYRGISLGTVTDTASGNTSAVQHVATAGDDTDKLYATLHVTTMGATTLDVKIQSDTVGFSSPTDRITFAQVSGPDSEFASEATDPSGGSDDYYRVVYTVGGAGTVTFTVTIGIRST